jgi:hypothetical protein
MWSRQRCRRFIRKQLRPLTAAGRICIPLGAIIAFAATA